MYESTAPPKAVPVFPAGSGAPSGAGTSEGDSCQPDPVPSRLIKTNYGNDENLAISRFRLYLEKREDWYIKIHGKVKLTGTEFLYRKTDIHRWKDGYLKKRLARLYKLREWFDAQPSQDVTMITLTVPHNHNKWGQKVRSGCNIWQSWENLKQGWNRIYQSRPGLFRDKEFVIFYEPHKSGYPHSHLMVFDTFTDEEVTRLKSTWSELTGADPLDGVDVRQGVGVKHLIAYLVKYMSKTLYHTIDEWTPGEWLFNAVAHEERYRLFGSSNNLAKIMRLQSDSDNTVECLDVSLEGLMPRDKDDEVCSARVWSNPCTKINDPLRRQIDVIPISDRVAAWKLRNNIVESEEEIVFKASQKAWKKYLRDHPGWQAMKYREVVA